jgi:hypothetical protein
MIISFLRSPKKPYRDPDARFSTYVFFIKQLAFGPLMHKSLFEYGFEIGKILGSVLLDSGVNKRNG